MSTIYALSGLRGPLRSPEEAGAGFGSGLSLPAWLDAQYLLKVMLDTDASDMHVYPGMAPSFKIHGINYNFPLSAGENGMPPLSGNQIHTLLGQLCGRESHLIRHIETLDSGKDIDFAITVKDVGRFRINAGHAQGQPFFVARQLPKEILEASQIGLPYQMMQDLLNINSGLLLVTGPTGSGKTTTLACIAKHLLIQRQMVIISIEDPTEFVFEPKATAAQGVHLKEGWVSGGMVIQREVGTDVGSFNEGLRSALREAPQVILVGELRDKETMRMALSAAETGHIVLATLHTDRAALAVSRITDEFPGAEQEAIRALLSTQLFGVLTQQLIPKIDGTGRVAALEYLKVNHSVAAVLRQNKDGAKNAELEGKIRSGGEEGMQLLDDELGKLYNSGIISYETALSYAHDKTQFSKSNSA